MTRLFASILTWLWATSLALAQAGQINPPEWGVGYVPAYTAAPNTVLVNARLPPADLNALAVQPITSWAITLPNPAYDGQLIGIACPGGNVGTITLNTTDGSSIDALPASNCAAGSTFVHLQFNQYAKRWYVLMGGGVNVTGSTSIIINGTTCVLGGSCSVTATAASMTVGTTTVLSGTSGYLLFNNGGVLGNEPATISVNGTICNVAGSCTVTAVASSLVVGTTSVSGASPGYVLYNNAGLLGNVAPTITVNGINCPLGGSCTITVAASLVVGSTPVGSGTSSQVLYNNAGVLGNEPAQVTVNGVACAIAGSCTVTAAPTTLTVGTTTITAGTNTQVLYNNAGVLGNKAGTTTVNGVVCNLAGSCTVTAVASSLTVGTTGISGGTNGYILYNNAGVLGNQLLSTAISSLIAVAADVWAGTAGKLVDAAVAQSAMAPQTIAISTSTFTPDLNNGINFELTLVHASCPCTLANIAHAFAGAAGFITVIQSATGSDLINTWGTNYKFPGGTKPTLSTGASAIDTMSYYCRTTSFCEISFAGNYQ